MNEYKQNDASEPERYTLAYRAPETRQVMNWVKAGLSGCLIGLRGVGKSNFLQFLFRPEVRRHYLGQGYADFVFVHLDLLTLTECTEWAVYELILDRLRDQLRPPDISAEIAAEAAMLHQEVIRTRDPFVAQRAVEQCVMVLCQNSMQHVVLLFDEFDAVFQTFAPFLFRGLRAIRDAHKDRVSYIVVVSNELACLRSDLTDIEHFHRLMSRNVCGLGPYRETDARQMIGYLAMRRSIELSAKNTALLIKFSGGHAGLIKAILSLLGNARSEDDLTEIAPGLRDEPVVQAECKKVWDSLPENEQIALCALTSGARADSNTLRRLKIKGLIPDSRKSPLLFSPWFADFCRQQTLPSKERIILDRSLGIATIDGQRINLTELEFEVLCYLYEHRGRVCTKDELIEHVYHQQYNRMAGGVTDEALQTLISRLRAKVEVPRCIRTVRGEGYKFVEPGESQT